MELILHCIEKIGNTKDKQFKNQQISLLFFIIVKFDLFKNSRKLLLDSIGDLCLHIGKHSKSFNLI